MIDYVGQRFGTVVVEQQLTKGSWLCKCDCGRYKNVPTHLLTSNHTQSCGCSRLSHGEIKISTILKEYNIPFEMEKTFKTCINPKTKRLLRFDFYVNN